MLIGRESRSIEQLIEENIVSVPFITVSVLSSGFVLKEGGKGNCRLQNTLL